MKKAKKIMALVLAAVMVMAMGMTAFAADPDYSITVTNAKEGETYKAFKMFDLSVDDPTNPTAFRYTVNSAWTAFAETDEFKAVFTVDEHLGAQVHLLTAFGTGIVHIAVLVLSQR